MIRLEPEQYKSLQPFVPDRPEATIPLFCVLTGRGEVFVDDRVTPRNLAIRMEGSDPGDAEKIYLFGNPGSDDLRRFLTELEDPAEVFCEEEFLPLLTELFEGAEARNRHVFYHDRIVEGEAPEAPVEIRRLRASDTAEVGGLVPSWGWSSYEGVREMLLSGAAFGTFEGDSLVSVAFLRDQTVKYETVGAVTAPTHRRRGLARACLTRLVRHSMDRGRLPRAIVAERNEAALALGERLGFPCRTEVTSWFLDIF